jgi:hypothetical protein
MKRVLALREQVPELKEGHCEYVNVQVSSDSVFAVSWRALTGVAVPLTNGPGQSPVPSHR